MNRIESTRPRERRRLALIGAVVVPAILGLAAVGAAAPASALGTCPTRVIDGPTSVQAGEQTEYSVDVNGVHQQDRVYDTLASDGGDFSSDGSITFDTPGTYQVSDRYQDAARCPAAADLTVTVAASPLTLHRPVTAGSSLENPDWGASRLTDGYATSLLGTKGYSSVAHPTAQATEWVSVDLGSVKPVGRVVLFPRTAVPGEAASTTGVDFPAAFTIQLSSDGTTWTDIVRVSGQSADDGAPRTYLLGPGASARYVRILATDLGRASTVYEPGMHRLQLAELQAWTS